MKFDEIKKAAEAEALRRGYTFTETREGDELVRRMYRPDGSLAMTARKPAPLKETE
jgi:hypothetical protein